MGGVSRYLQGAREAPPGARGNLIAGDTAGSTAASILQISCLLPAASRLAEIRATRAERLRGHSLHRCRQPSSDSLSPGIPRSAQPGASCRRRGQYNRRARRLSLRPYNDNLREGGIVMRNKSPRHSPRALRRDTANRDPERPGVCASSRPHPEVRSRRSQCWW